ncbi:hypothetical protein IF1G_00400 [Cordyceps javanica]|uniref:Uncharacterized protein n=1 Tax=Cordyceps javanica TaxID=43265 RepID=A0A545VFH1_9HYPO|nr:hypothetical protein IF1G_00400 [Cordyceps javanica]
MYNVTLSVPGKLDFRLRLSVDGQCYEYSRSQCYLQTLCQIAATIAWDITNSSIQVGNSGMMVSSQPGTLHDAS